MTPQEFQAWFDGFTEGLDGLPNEKQWERIKQRVAQIDGTSVTQYNYHTYQPPIWLKPVYHGPHYSGDNIWCSSGGVLQSSGVEMGAAHVPPTDEPWASSNAMHSLGKADATLLGESNE